MPATRGHQRRAAALTDAQKGDLACLWETHAPDETIAIGGGGGGGDIGSGRGRGRGRGRSGSGIARTTVVSMSLDDEDYAFICRLYSYLHWSIVDSVEQQTRQKETASRPKSGANADNDDDDDDDDDNLRNVERSRTWESLSFLFHNVRSLAPQNTNSVTTGRVVSPDGIDRTSMIVPRIMGGKQSIQFDHASFLEEMSAFEDGTLSHGDNNNNNNNNSSSALLPIDEQEQRHPKNPSYGSYLHIKPDRALASLGCAIGLNVLSLWRRHQSNPLQHNRNRDAHPHLRTLLSALYRPRFFNLAPSSHVRMAAIRTSTVGRLIALRGTVTKARPKRLRVLDAGFTCSACGLHQIAKFVEGKYSSPARCEDMKCRRQKFVLNRRVANFCDVQELKIQEAREELCEDENDDGDGGGLDEQRGAPRHMEVEVSNDLVDACQAGDSIVVCGIVRAMNSSLAIGRGGKRAAETSTYQLYVVGHSITNLTADDHGGGIVGDGGGDGDKHEMMGSEIDQGRNKRSKMSASSANMQYTDRQLKQITDLAHADHRMYSMPTRMAFPFDLLCRSICPTIIGNDLVKAGILLCLLGGTPPESSGLEAQSGITIRSNSHMLVVGDPGMGKSQMLLAANQVASRSVYVGGNTASSTGLTASITKEPGGDMGIEAGALVLADRGVCCLDELDKMPKSHQDGLLEAMEQQQVSIAKAGVVASLPSRCSVIAAANPKSGHYDMSKTVSENVNMAGPLLSRFDLVFILRDEANADRDRMISGSIMGRLGRGGFQGDGYRDSSVNGGGRLAETMNQFGPQDRVPLVVRLPWVTDFQKQPLPLQQVKDYVAYAREHCRPKMTDAAATVLSDYFMRLRHPQGNENKRDNVPITTRQLEALIRLSQARAKACLRPYVLREDAEDVIELMIESVRQVHTDGEGNIDKSRGGAGGKSKQRKAFLEAMRTSEQIQFEYSDLQRIADRLNLPVGGFKDFLDNLREQGEIAKRSSDGHPVYTLL